MTHRFTRDERLANRQRMEQLGLWRRAESMPRDQRQSYVRGNLQVHLAITRQKRGTTA